MYCNVCNKYRKYRLEKIEERRNYLVREINQNK